MWRDPQINLCLGLTRKGKLPLRRRRGLISKAIILFVDVPQIAGSISKEPKNLRYAERYSRSGSVVVMQNIAESRMLRAHFWARFVPYLILRPRRHLLKLHGLPGRRPFSKACLQHSQTVIQPCMRFLLDGTV